MSEQEAKGLKDQDYFISYFLFIDTSIIHETSPTLARNEPEYETMPRILATKEEEELNANMSSSTADFVKTPAVYSCVNKAAQDDTERQHPAENIRQSSGESATKEPHYEELPLPDVSEIHNEKPSNESQPALDNTEILDQKKD